MHRDDGPAEIHLDKSGNPRISIWYRHGYKHRIGVPAVEIKYFSGEEWWENGEIHRYYAPAVKGNGVEEWWTRNKRNRLDGPAVIMGNKREYYIEGKKYKYFRYYRITRIIKKVCFNFLKKLKQRYRNTGLPYYESLINYSYCSYK